MHTVKKYISCIEETARPCKIYEYKENTKNTTNLMRLNEIFIAHGQEIHIPHMADHSTVWSIWITADILKQIGT